MEKNTGNINPRVSKTINGKPMMLSKCAVCRSTKSGFIKKQEASGILNNLGFQRGLDKIPFFGGYLL